MARNHIMIDIETLGTKPGSVIVSIGAVAFDPYAGVIVDAENIFYALVDLVDAQEAGLRIDAATVQWWMKQSEEARRALTASNRMRTFPALIALRDFVDSHTDLGDVARVWSHGAGFDIVLLEAAYHKVGPPVPWSYKSPRDTRTLFELASIRLEDFPYGVEHNALDDAIAQARAVVAAYQKLGLQTKPE